MAFRLFAQTRRKQSKLRVHYNDFTMATAASLISSLTIVYSTVYSSADQRKHQSSASPAFVQGIHRRPVNSPHKWPVTRKMFPFDDVIMSLASVRGNHRWLVYPCKRASNAEMFPFDDVIMVASLLDPHTAVFWFAQFSIGNSRKVPTARPGWADVRCLIWDRSFMHNYDDVTWAPWRRKGNPIFQVLTQFNHKENTKPYIAGPADPNHKISDAETISASSWLTIMN